MSDVLQTIHLWLQRRVPGSGFDDEGVAALKRDNDTLLMLEVPATQDVCHFYAPVAPLPEEDRDTVLLGALSLNVGGKAFGGCWLAWEDELQMLVLCWNLALQRADEIAFNNAIDNFMRALDEARSMLLLDPEGHGNTEMEFA
jgi:hypothetical protein